MDKAVSRLIPPRPDPAGAHRQLKAAIMFCLCVTLAALVATSVYLRAPEGNLLRQLCLNSVAELAKHAKTIPPRHRRWRGSRLCTYAETVDKGDRVLKIYRLGSTHMVEFELAGWPFWRSEVHRLRAANLVAEGNPKRMPLAVKYK